MTFDDVTQQLLLEVHQVHFAANNCTWQAGLVLAPSTFTPICWYFYCNKDGKTSSEPREVAPPPPTEEGPASGQHSPAARRTTIPLHSARHRAIVCGQTCSVRRSETLPHVEADGQSPDVFHPDALWPRPALPRACGSTPSVSGTSRTQSDRTAPEQLCLVRSTGGDLVYFSISSVNSLV